MTGPEAALSIGFTLYIAWALIAVLGLFLGALFGASKRLMFMFFDLTAFLLLIGSGYLIVRIFL